MRGDGALVTIFHNSTLQQLTDILLFAVDKQMGKFQTVSCLLEPTQPNNTCGEEERDRRGKRKSD